MEMTYTIDKKINEKAKKQMMYWAMASMTVFFGGFCSYYLVMHGNGNWLVFNLPDISIISTAIIITSSLTMLVAQLAIKRGNLRLTTLALFITFVLGIAFFYTQLEGWRQLTAQGIYFVGKYANVSGSFLYFIALMHLFHMIGGIIALIVSLTKCLLKKYSASDYLGIELSAIYWHFLDLLWVYLFLFLYFYR